MITWQIAYMSNLGVLFVYLCFTLICTYCVGNHRRRTGGDKGEVHLAELLYYLRYRRTDGWTDYDKFFDIHTYNIHKCSFGALLSTGCSLNIVFEYCA